MIVAVQGVLAGVAHVLSGPDHLAGVAPLAVETDRRIRPGVVGATWGLGHGLGVALIGVAGQTLLSAAQVEVASGWAERLVGVVLVVLGVITVRRARTLVVHEHAHDHDGDQHVHLHVHAKAGDRDDHAQAHTAADHDEGHAHGHGKKAFGVGVLHGLAGAGHFWAALPSLAMTRPDAAVYIGSYVVASLALMALLGAALGWCARTVGVAWLPRLLSSVGVVTVVVGVWWTAAAFGLL